MGFGLILGIRSEPMVEEIPLPDHPLPPGEPALQAGDLPCQAPGMAPPGDQVKVVGHEGAEQELEPARLLGMGQGHPDRLTGGLVGQGPGARPLAAEGHEPAIMRVDPRRTMMGKLPAVREHPETMSESSSRVETDDSSDPS
jgi:hypothetical protein